MIRIFQFGVEFLSKKNKEIRKKNNIDCKSQQEQYVPL